MSLVPKQASCLELSPHSKSSVNLSAFFSLHSDSFCSQRVGFVELPFSWGDVTKILCAIFPWYFL